MADIDLEFVGKIVAGFVSKNPIAADKLPELIGAVHKSLAGLGEPAEPPEPREPAVPIRRSYGRDFVICLECGWRGLILKRHLATSHGLSIPKYRARWGLSLKHPTIAAGHSEHRSSLTKERWLGRKQAACESETPALAIEAAAPPGSELDPALLDSLANPRKRRGRKPRQAE